MATKTEILRRLYKENGLEQEDVFTHDHYKIIKREGIDKIQAKQAIDVSYEVVKCESTFCVVKATGRLNDKTIETFGSALKGGYKEGNTNTWYVMEMAEKRAMSRAVLKLAGFYAVGHYGEDESESFDRRKNKSSGPTPTPTQSRNAEIVQAKADLDVAKENGDLEAATNIYEDAMDKDWVQVCDYHTALFGGEKVA
jgi:hypothetical protein